MCQHKFKRVFCLIEMEILDIVFFVLALAFVAAAIKAHNCMEEDDIAGHRAHFTIALILLVGMLGVFYMRSHGGVCAVMDKPFNFTNMFPGMRLSKRRRSSSK